MAVVTLMLLAEGQNKTVADVVFGSPTLQSLELYNIAEREGVEELRAAGCLRALSLMHKPQSADLVGDVTGAAVSPKSKPDVLQMPRSKD